MKNRMKRRVSRVLLVLAAGVVINVAVAWAIGILGLRFHETASAFEVTNLRRHPHRDLMLKEEIWTLVVYRGVGVVAFTSVREKGVAVWHTSDEPGTIEALLPAWSNLATPTEAFAANDVDYTYWPDGGTEVFDYVWNLAVGWPLPVLWCEILIDLDYVEDDSAVGGLLVKEPASVDRFPSVLPYRVIVPNFAVNAALYAVLAGLVWFTPGIIRRRIRARRGLCQACGYPVEHGQRCSECGTVRDAEAARD